MYGQQPYFAAQPNYQQNYGPPPPMMFNPPPPQNQTIVIMGNQKEPTITNLAHFGNASQCPFCNKETKNILRRKTGCTTIGWCLCLLFTTGFFFWIPFCCDGCKDTDCMC